MGALIKIRMEKAHDPSDFCFYGVKPDGESAMMAVRQRRIFKYLTGYYTGGVTQWSWEPYLPRGAGGGAWTPAVDLPLVQCLHGYHVVPVEGLAGPHCQTYLYEAEGRGMRMGGERIDGSMEMVYQSVRLVRQVETWNRARLMVPLIERVRGTITRLLPGLSGGRNEGGPIYAALNRAAEIEGDWAAGRLTFAERFEIADGVIREMNDFWYTHTLSDGTWVGTILDRLVRDVLLDDFSQAVSGVFYWESLLVAAIAGLPLRRRFGVGIGVLSQDDIPESVQAVEVAARDLDRADFQRWLVGLLGVGGGPLASGLSLMV
jgi:hypothetical protein